MSADLTWEGTCPVVQEQPHVLRCGQPGHARRPALRPARHLERHHRRRRRGDRRRPGRLARQPRPLLGDPPRGGGGAPGSAGGPAVRGHVVALRPDAVRGLRRRPDHPGGPGRLPHAQRLHPRLEGRPRRAARLAASIDVHYRSGTRIPTGATIRCATTPEGKPVVARGRVAARRTPPRRRRLRRRPRLDPRHVEGRGLRRAGHLRHGRRRRAGPLHVRLRRPRRPRHRSTATRASASSSTSASAGTTRPASPTSSPSPPKHDPRRPHEPRPHHLLHRRRLGRPGHRRHDPGRLAALRAGRRDRARGQRGRHRRRRRRRPPRLRPRPVAADDARRSGSTSSRTSPTCTPARWARWPS